ncbi:MAG: hypothetical protein ACK559_37700, partial [bacterium]
GGHVPATAVAGGRPPYDERRGHAERRSRGQRGRHRPHRAGDGRCRIGLIRDELGVVRLCQGDGRALHRRVGLPGLAEVDQGSRGGVSPRQQRTLARSAFQRSSGGAPP